jgi:DNA-binding response OmpR family regulator
MKQNGSGAALAAAGRVLVADDEESTRQLLRDLLEAQGHEVTEATNGHDSLSSAKTYRPDVVVLDVLMPGLDGMEVCRRLKGDPATAAMPVLLVTSLTDRQDRLTGIRAGANDFLTKPIDTQEVALRVRNEIRARRLYDELAENYRRLRALESLRDDLTHMIVHDLRTPLSSLISGLQRIPVMGPLNATQQECLEIAIEEGNGLLAMIGDLLDIGKMEAGALQLQYHDLDPGELVEAAARQLARLAKEKRQTLRLKVPEYLPTFSGDRDKLQRTLANLLGNAIKFTPKEDRSPSRRTSMNPECRSGSRSRTPGRASRARRSSGSSKSSGRSRPATAVSRALRAWAWPSARWRSKRTAASSGSRAKWERGALSVSPSRSSQVADHQSYVVASVSGPEAICSA